MGRLSDDEIARLLDGVMRDSGTAPEYPGLYHVLRAGTGEPEVLFTSADEDEARLVRDELAAARPHGDLTAYVVDVSWPGERFVVDLEIEAVTE